jgi:hypothetical protein
MYDIVRQLGEGKTLAAIASSGHTQTDYRWLQTFVCMPAVVRAR